jgi:hypothetical protein
MPTIHQEIWLIVGPYMVSLMAHFVIFCLTMIALVLMLAISWWVVSFCEKTLKVDPLAVKILVGASDLLIIGHFALYLGHGLSL